MKTKRAPAGNGKPRAAATATTAKPGAEGDTYKVVELARISTRKHWNPRTVFEQTELNELAANIGQNGFIQPMVVRELKSGAYEVIAGERRYRASKLLKLKTVPVIVRELTDEAAYNQTLSENVARVQLSPVEEAEAFARLRDEFNLPPGEIAKRTGQSLQKVVSRLQLAVLSPEVKQAGLQGLPVAYLGILAQVSNHALQDKLLYRMTHPQYGRGKDAGLVDLEEAERLLDGYRAPISGGQFKPSDALLLPAAGACGDCPYNTSNMPREVFPRKEICTNVSCFWEKQELHYVQLTKASSDVEQIPPSKAKTLFQSHGNGGLVYSAGLIDLDETSYEVNNKAWRTALGKFNGQFMPAQILTFNPYRHRTVWLVKEADARAALKKIKAKEQPGRAKDEDSASARDKAAARKRKRETKAVSTACNAGIERIMQDFNGHGLEAELEVNPLNGITQLKRIFRVMLLPFSGYASADTVLRVLTSSNLLTLPSAKKDLTYQVKDKLVSDFFKKEAETLSFQTLVSIVFEATLRHGFSASWSGYGEAKVPKELTEACSLYDVDLNQIYQAEIAALKTQEKLPKGKRAKKGQMTIADAEAAALTNDPRLIGIGEQATICEHGRIIMKDAAVEWVERLHGGEFLEDHPCVKGTTQQAVVAEAEQEFRDYVTEYEAPFLQDSQPSGDGDGDGEEE
ncbi:MAG TPA: ParB/RepB/Spo0J family partition protein [Blastocatellia bacterium]